jgi:hypothetical protein
MSIAKTIHTTKSVRKRCGLSSIFFGLGYTSILPRWWSIRRYVHRQGAKTIEQATPLSLLYADDQVLLNETEDVL